LPLLIYDIQTGLSIFVEYRVLNIASAPRRAFSILSSEPFKMAVLNSVARARPALPRNSDGDPSSEGI